MKAVYRTAIAIACAIALWPGLARPAWELTSYTDEMTSQEVQLATTTSANAVEFDFPYGGPQNALLQLRLHPRYGRNVILSLSRAQFLCPLDGCNILVRFDGRKAETYRAREPSDHSTDALFIGEYDDFVRKLAKAKQVRIEALFYQSGTKVFTFNVAGLPENFSAGIEPELDPALRCEIEADVESLYGPARETFLRDCMKDSR
jgi:hypothetical protein